MTKRICYILTLLLLLISLTGCKNGKDYLHTMYGEVIQINIGNHSRTVIIKDKNNQRVDIQSIETSSSTNDWYLVAEGDYVYIEYFLGEDDWFTNMNTATIFKIIED